MWLKFERTWLKFERTCFRHSIRIFFVVKNRLSLIGFRECSGSREIAGICIWIQDFVPIPTSEEISDICLKMVFTPLYFLKKSSPFNFFRKKSSPPIFFEKSLHPLILFEITRPGYRINFDISLSNFVLGPIPV